MAGRAAALAGNRRSGAAPRRGSSATRLPIKIRSFQRRMVIMRYYFYTKLRYMQLPSMMFHVTTGAPSMSTSVSQRVPNRRFFQHISGGVLQSFLNFYAKKLKPLRFGGITLANLLPCHLKFYPPLMKQNTKLSFANYPHQYQNVQSTAYRNILLCKMHNLHEDIAL